MSPEYDSGIEAASQAQLVGLYDHASRLAQSKGTYFVEPSAEVKGTHNGLLIIDDPPAYSIDVPFDKLKELAAESVDALNLTGPMEITYFLPAYGISIRGDLQYSSPSLHMSVIHKDRRPGISGYFYIVNDSDGVRGLKRGEEWSGVQTGGTLENFISNFTGSEEVELALGINNITRTEVEALQQIVDALDKSQP